MLCSIDWVLILKLSLATFFGAAVGFERYIHGRPAGLRTYILVCVAFASLAILSETRYFEAVLAGASGYRPDPARLIAGGLTGIGFLGAGIIIRSGVTVHGLTTAAAIWAISVVGLAVGSGNYQLAALLFLIVLASMVILKYFEGFLKRDMFKVLVIKSDRLVLSLEGMQALVMEKGLEIISTDVDEDRSEGVVTYSFLVRAKTERAFLDAYRAVASRGEIRSVRLLTESCGSN